MSEEWRDIPGWLGYQASTEGRIRSLNSQWTKPRILRGTLLRTGYIQLHLGVDGRRRHLAAHTAVLLAFFGPCPEGLETRHLDGNPANNHPENLAWGTHSENNQDRVRHGTHAQASRVRCVNGHLFDWLNTYVRPDTGTRQCRACAAERKRAYARRAA